MTDAATGAVVQRIQYDFGRVLSDSAPGMQPFGFAGGLYDAETKLVRFGARDYSSDGARWNGRDPRRFNQPSENFYSYVAGDPINFVDVDGEAAAFVVVVIVVAILATLDGCSFGDAKCTYKLKKKIDRYHDQCTENEGSGNILGFGQSKPENGMSSPDDLNMCKALETEIKLETQTCARKPF